LGIPSSRRPAAAPRVRVPGERLFRDGDRVLHARFGEGVVVTSKLTRTDEEVTVAFRDGGVKTLLASIANLEITG
jgi:DNA helicase-2/ATP-dependent DNA helicase PcrA